MDTSRAEAIIRNALSNHVSTPAAEIPLDQSMSESGLDSLDVIEYVMEVEEAVPGLEIPHNVVDAHFSGRASVQSAIDWLAANA
jgi:acyl carrier protein